MSFRITSALSAFALLSGVLLVPNLAQAKALDQCGGVYLSVDSHCEFKPMQECETTCTTSSTEQVCAQKTYETCASSCTVTDTTSCKKTHTESCSKQCETISTKSSREVCVSECSDSCTSSAVSNNHFGGDHGKCQKNCDHDCNVRCDSSSTSDQTTDCETKCLSVVESECIEEVNRDCVLSCQTDNYETCQTETVNTCNTTCKDKGGALFCDGQFIGASNLQACADQLASEFSFNIDVTAQAVADTASDCADSVSKKCSFSPPAPDRRRRRSFGCLGGARSGAEPSSSPRLIPNERALTRRAGDAQSRQLAVPSRFDAGRPRLMPRRPELRLSSAGVVFDALKRSGQKPWRGSILGGKLRGKAEQREELGRAEASDLGDTPCADTEQRDSARLVQRVRRHHPTVDRDRGAAVRCQRD